MKIDNTNVSNILQGLWSEY